MDDFKEFCADVFPVNNQDIDEQKKRNLYEGLDEATDTHERRKFTINPEATKKESIERCELILKALDKLQRRSGTRSAALKSIFKHFEKIKASGLLPYIDESLPDYYSSHNYLTTFDIAQSLKNINIDQEDDQRIIKTLKVTFERFINQLPKLGAGSKRQAIKYYWGINTLADVLKVELPEYKPSSKDDSLFHEYIKFWLSKRIGVNQDIVRRHIENWKKLS